MYTKPICYLSGPITGRANAKEIFDNTASVLTGAGWVVLNPCVLPMGMTQEQYMHIDLAMLDKADVMILLDGYETSRGVSIELAHAAKEDKPVLRLVEAMCLDVTMERSDTIRRAVERMRHEIHEKERKARKGCRRGPSKQSLTAAD